MVFSEESKSQNSDEETKTEFLLMPTSPDQTIDQMSDKI